MPPPTSTLTGTSTPDYSFSLTFAPNGNVLTANDNINGNWNYAYDQFNRLACSNLASNGTCASPTSGTPTYSYVYDRFGNRWQQNGQFSFSASFTGNSPAQPANNNRMDGYTYDAAGNLLSDGNHTYFYDAENRLIQVDGTLGTCSSGGTTGTTACYYYDAEGHRVWRTGFTNDTCDNTGKRGYIYDLAGRWLAEVNGNGGGCNAEIYAGGRHVASQYAGTTNLDHTDWLGTSRLRTDYQYTTSHGFWIGQSCTSLPFGDATSCHGGEGSSPLVFTGKELDNESGLDNFGARYDSSSMGRFMSPDWSASAEPVPYAKLDDPQSLNLYTFARNNPLGVTDPDGHCWSWVSEKLCNLWNYGYFVDNAHLETALQKDADAARKELTNGNVQHDGQNPEEYLKGKSNKEVLDLWHEFISSGVRGTLGAVGMLGANGARFDSKTLWQDGKARIDVENSAPGKRPGQIHYQEGPEGAPQYKYDPATGTFPELSATKNRELLSNPEVQKAIQKALKYLGEGQ